MGITESTGSMVLFKGWSNWEDFELAKESPDISMQFTALNITTILMLLTNGLIKLH